MKILFHCFPGYTPIAKELVSFARSRGDAIEWSIILYSNSEGLLDDLEKLVGVDNVCYLQGHLNEYMEKHPSPDLSAMKDFPASVFECVSTSKIHFGHISLQHKDRGYQLRLIAGTYAIYKEFLLKNRPDHVFFPLVEQYDAMILYHLCKELHIDPIIYDHARNLGIAFLTNSLYQSLPPYAFSRQPQPPETVRAEAFIKVFREVPTKAFAVPHSPKPDEIIDTSYLHKSLTQKAIQFATIRTAQAERHVVDRFTMVHNLRIHFIGLTNWVRNRKIKRLLKQGRKIFDILTISELPPNFVYYPLQYTPESSINTPAPYFADQLRTVDLILSALPANHFLVIRDHKVKFGERDKLHKDFYASLKQRAAVLIADPDINNLDILKRAVLTVSVTGTSCLEAFLLGKPSLHIGKIFFTDWISQFNCMASFRQDLRAAIEAREVPFEKIVDFVSRVFTIGHDFVLYSVGGVAFGNTAIVMNTRNFQVFLDALQNHIERMKSETP